MQQKQKDDNQMPNKTKKIINWKRKGFFTSMSYWFEPPKLIALHHFTSNLSLGITASPDYAKESNKSQSSGEHIYGYGVLVWMVKIPF